MDTRLETLRKIPLELVFWCSALFSLWWLDPFGSHYSLCPLHNLGMDWCPGCGLGRSMSLLMKGELTQSWNRHPLGAFALLIILHRIFQIINHLKSTRNYG